MDINFYKLFPEDRFKIIYDAKYINNNFYEVEKVYASVFLHNGKDNYAIAFSKKKILIPLNITIKMEIILESFS